MTYANSKGSAMVVVEQISRITDQLPNTVSCHCDWEKLHLSSDGNFGPNNNSPWASLFGDCGCL